jgi:WD40 repeat protein
VDSLRAGDLDAPHCPACRSSRSLISVARCRRPGGSFDGTIRLFDIATEQPLGAPLRAVPNRVTEPEFTPDGAFLFGVTNVGKAYRWDVRPAAWARRACAIAGRSLTRTEWSDVLPGRKYDPAC